MWSPRLGLSVGATRISVMVPAGVGRSLRPAEAQFQSLAPAGDALQGGARHRAIPIASSTDLDHPPLVPSFAERFEDQPVAPPGETERRSFQQLGQLGRRERPVGLSSHDRYQHAATVTGRCPLHSPTVERPGDSEPCTRLRRVSGMAVSRLVGCDWWAQGWSIGVGPMAVSRLLGRGWSVEDRRRARRWDTHRCAA